MIKNGIQPPRLQPPRSQHRMSQPRMQHHCMPQHPMQLRVHQPMKQPMHQLMQSHVQQPKPTLPKKPISIPCINPNPHPNVQKQVKQLLQQPLVQPAVEVSNTRWPEVKRAQNHHPRNGFTHSNHKYHKFYRTCAAIVKSGRLQNPHPLHFGTKINDPRGGQLKKKKINEIATEFNRLTSGKNEAYFKLVEIISECEKIMYPILPRLSKAEIARRKSNVANLRKAKKAKQARALQAKKTFGRKKGQGWL